MPDNDEAVVRWLVETQPGWAELGFKEALKRFKSTTGISASSSNRRWNAQVRQAYASAQSRKEEAATTEAQARIEEETRKEQSGWRYGQEGEFSYVPQGNTPPPSGYMALRGALYNDLLTGDSWQILMPDLPRADLLTPQVANYSYQNILAYNMATGETKPLRDVSIDPIGKTLPYQNFMSALSYQALTNELIQSGVQEEDFQIPEVQEWLKGQMDNVVLGRPMEQVKQVADWMKYVGESTRQLKQTQESWKLHQSTPANVWMDKDIIRQMNPQGYQSDEYQWQPLVKKAVAKPQRMTTL